MGKEKLGTHNEGSISEPKTGVEVTEATLFNMANKELPRLEETASQELNQEDGLDQKAKLDKKDKLDKKVEFNKKTELNKKGKLNQELSKKNPAPVQGCGKTERQEDISLSEKHKNSDTGSLEGLDKGSSKKLNKEVKMNKEAQTARALSSNRLPSEGLHKDIEENMASLAYAQDYTKLLKTRVMSLVVFTALTGLLVAPGHINLILGFIAILCIAVGGGAAGTLNMWYDADIDKLMKRTQKRPIPAGKVTGDQALSFGLFLALFSVIVMGIFVNWFSAFFLAFTIFYYVVIYTIWLKRITPQNIVIGGASGAFPPMIGWAAVTGSISIESIVLFLIIFLWTPPHFWALSLFTTGDYGAAKIPMLPNIAGVKATKNQILIYALFMSVVGIMPFLLHFAGIIYGIVALIMGLIFSYESYLLWKAEEGEKTIFYAKKLFFFSLYYLSVLFSVLLIENLLCRYLFAGIGSWGNILC